MAKLRLYSENVYIPFVFRRQQSKTLFTLLMSQRKMKKIPLSYKTVSLDLNLPKLL